MSAASIVLRNVLWCQEEKKSLFPLFKCVASETAHGATEANVTGAETFAEEHPLNYRERPILRYTHHRAAVELCGGRAVAGSGRQNTCRRLEKKKVYI
ncbi:hypothetical protein BaRGS_00000433 [Batillaria attramentaria]|uniref:Uncharacterized protein n=1 Tax=Batillaria attramentaria TaxID=370345 RepID=A0ABD0M9Q9_9CAEN